MTPLKRALRQVPGLRRAAQPALRAVRRARILRGDSPITLDSPAVPVQDLRWVAQAAGRRGATELAESVLFVLVARGSANEGEQRAIRALGTAQPLPATALAGPGSAPATALAGPGTVPADTAEAGPAGPAGTPAAGPVLLLGPDPSGPGVRATLATPDGAPLPATGLDIWQPAWNALPAPLAEQLAACVLTRVARLRSVSGVRATDPRMRPLAAAVAAAAGTVTPTGENQP